MTSSGSSAPLIDQHASVDVLIVGDGLVGRPLALALADSGHAVALVDRNPVSDNATPAEQPLNERCTAFSVGTVDWLERHRLWFSEAAAAEPIKRVHVSQMGHFGSTRIEAAEIGREALGWTVENRCFTRSLRARLDASNVQRLPERVVQGFSQWLDERLPARAGRVMAVGPRIQLPLQRIEAKQQYDHRVVLVGNAARLLHPVAGQGYNLAVRDIAALVDALDGAQDPWI